MSIYGEDENEQDLGHPDSAIRLASAVHRFRIPEIDTAEKKISFSNSFRTTGTHDKTRRVLLKADEARKSLLEGLQAKKVSFERVVGDARRYTPIIHQILLSCKVQPEVARLDERLLFRWSSGIEKDGDTTMTSAVSLKTTKTKKKVYQSEALMFDLVMSVVCEGLGRAGSATENSVSGEFAAASRDYAAAAGVFSFLANDQLPKWISKGSSVDEDSLPLECSVGVAKALHRLWTANAQQMAVATVLVKPGTPNYSLLAKLCLGVHEQLDEFNSIMQKEAFALKSRMEKEFFTLIAFQIQMQKSLSLYFQARTEWDKAKYGIAIALLSEASVHIQTRQSEASAKGVPDVTRTVALKPLNNDLKDLRHHMQTLLNAWETDNSRVYFENVPQVLPAENMLQEGLQMNKMEPFSLVDVDPLLLILPPDKNSTNDKPRSTNKPPPPPSYSAASAGPVIPPPPPAYHMLAPMAPPPFQPPPLQRSDSDLARELQKKWNMEG